jgi:hypothetical protein
VFSRFLEITDIIYSYSFSIYYGIWNSLVSKAAGIEKRLIPVFSIYLLIVSI